MRWNDAARCRVVSQSAATQARNQPVRAERSNAQRAHNRATGQSPQRVAVLAGLGVRPCQVSRARFAVHASTATTHWMMLGSSARVTDRDCAAPARPRPLPSSTPKRGQPSERAPLWSIIKSTDLMICSLLPSAKRHNGIGHGLAIGPPQSQPIRSPRHLAKLADVLGLEIADLLPRRT